MVHKIVTKRNTSFRIGLPKDSAEGSATITEINKWYESPTENVMTFGVEYSDGTKVTVNDVVEVWEK